MLRAVYRGRVLAEAPRTVRLEGNHYFPPKSLTEDLFARSGTKTLCPWKGIAQYYNLTDGKDLEPDLAWSYRRPVPLARRIKNHMAFGPGVAVAGEPDESSPGIGARLRELWMGQR